MTAGMIITSIINSILGTILVVYSGKVLFDDKDNVIISGNSILPTIIYIVFLSVNDYIMDRLLRIIIAFSAIIILYKMVYKKDWYKTIITSLVMYSLILFTEVIYCAILYISVILKANTFFEIISTSIMANLIVISIVLILLRFLKNALKSLLKILDKHSDKASLILFIALLLVLSVILTRLDLRKQVLTIEFYINIAIVIVLFVVLFLYARQKYNYAKFGKKYKQLSVYSNLTDSVLEDYQIKNHEYKNQLTIIKSLANPKNKELIEYVDTLIEKNKNVKYSWVNQVKYINLAGLKGLLNNKIMELNSLNIKTNIIVSKKVEKIKFKDLNIKDKDDLYSIIGVFIDNAKEASLKCEKPIVNIDISVENGEVIIIISNTYNEIINKDKIDEYKYSTKGKERGIGLYMVKKIIDRNNKFLLEREITENYFIEKLHIKST